jgi:hypothetical protein
MTALSEYQRLECVGLWRESPEAQRRDVLVTFGDATIILRELPSERALSHWSLPAVIRTNPGRMPALFAPAADSAEELEIDDVTMIAAIGKVHALIAARRPRPGRLRGALLAGVAALLLGGLVFWLPGALIAQTARVLPATTRTEVGRAILQDLQRLTGAPCAAPEAAASLAALSERLLGAPGRLVILPSGLTATLHVPGNMVAAGAPLVLGPDGPDPLAVHVLAERLRSEAEDPLIPALEHAGLRATFQLLTTGAVPAEAFAGYGEVLLRAAPRAVPDALLIERAAEKGVPTSPYAYAVDPTGESTIGLIEADPFAAAPPDDPLIDDSGWVALQAVCG